MVDSSYILINRVISVEEGREKIIGIYTLDPLVDTEIEGTVIVGGIKFTDDEGLMTWTVVGKIFLKYVLIYDSNFSKLIVYFPGGTSDLKYNVVDFFRV